METLNKINEAYATAGKTQWVDKCDGFPTAFYTEYVAAEVSLSLSLFSCRY